jgi:hypothetical protein
MQDRRWLLVAVLACACGTSDNLVVGGFAGDAKHPVTVLDNIRSSISGTVTVTDASNKQRVLSVVAISDHANLCDAVTAKPDFFRNPPDVAVTLILYAPTDKIGTFVIGRPGDEGTNAELVATLGPTVPVAPYFASLGTLSLSNFDTNPGGFAQGSFDVVFLDPAGVPREFYGRFKTHVCPGMAQVLLP